MKPKSFFKGPYFPKHSENRMNNEGALAQSREHFFENRPSNLYFLLHKRYTWMNQFLANKSKVIEVGAGGGFSAEFIKSEFFLTDFSKNPWLNMVLDAQNLPMKSESLDAVISSHMIHHLSKPKVFFDEIHRVLKSGGRLLIQELNSSLLMRFLFRLMRHEGWSYEVDVFDSSSIANDPSDPWSANIAIPELLFSSPHKFEENFKGFKIIHNQLSECIIFPISGGVTAKTFTINLPWNMLKLVDYCDDFLVKTCPLIFASGRSVVLEKR